MSKSPNHEADIKNGNWGTPGTNTTWDKAQGNRGKQLNPNQQPGYVPPVPPAAPNHGQGANKPSNK